MAKGFMREYAKNFKEILGAILVGSASFGVKDEFVDIDIIVYADKESVKERKANGKGYNETYKFKGTEICIDWNPIQKLEENVSNGKDDEALWVFSNTKIIYDPKGTIKKLLNKIRPYPKELRRKKIFLHFYLLKAILENCEKAILRREMLTAAFLIHKAVDELSYLTFILEGCFVPYPKWRFYFMNKLSLGKKLLPKIETVLCIKKLSKEELTRKLDGLNEVIEGLKPHLCEAGIPKQWLGSEWWKYEPDWDV